jgi:hypothetical protein
MGIDVVIVCVGTGINLALWGAVYLRLDRLPWSVWSLARKERLESDAAGQTLLQERTATKVGAIVKSLREYDEHVAASFRAQVAEAQVRARVAERQSADAGVALAAASTLVRDLRGLLDGQRAARRGVSEGEERLSGDDELTSVSSHRLPGGPDDLGRTLASPTSGTRGAQ